MEVQCFVLTCDAFNREASIMLSSEASIMLPQPKKAWGFPQKCLANVLVMTSHLQNETFSSQYGDREDTGLAYKLFPDIVTIVMLFNSTRNPNANVNLTFKCDACNQAALCVFWDFRHSRWSSEGCRTQVNSGIANCFCRHLSSFSVLMSSAGPPSDSTHSNILDHITTAGLIISIICLLQCILFYAILINQTGASVMASYQQYAVLHMSVFLLISNFFFFGLSYVTPKDQPKFCIAITFGLHYSLLGFFCWTLVKGVTVACRLVFTFYFITRKQYLVLSILLGYLCPVVIAVATFLAFYPNRYMQDERCWLEYRSGAMMAFIAPAIIVMSGNFLVLVVVIRTFLRPPISDGRKRDQEVVKKLMKAVLFCIPQFGLTWAVGILLFIEGQNMILHYMFAVLNPLQVSGK